MAAANLTTGEISPELLSRIRTVITHARQYDLSLPLIIRRNISGISPRGWLGNQSSERKIYWRNRDGSIEIAGVGDAYAIDSEEFGTIQRLIDDDRMRFIFVRAFTMASKQDNIWTAFPRHVCFLPRTVICRGHDVYAVEQCLVVTPNDSFDDIQRQIHNLSFTANDADMRQPVGVTLQLKRHRPDAAGWAKNIDACKQAMAGGTVDKVVLSRRSDFETDREVNPFDFFCRLAEGVSGTFQLYFQPDTACAFMSLTPERLFHRTGRALSLEAIAATENRGGDDDEDNRLRQKLIADSKQQNEHRFVVNYIVEKTAPLCGGSVRVEPAGVLKLDRIQHLRTPVFGTVDKVDDIGLVERLHPTPAVGGYPKDSALTLIDRLEPFDRGLYASPVGIVSHEETEIAVGIRSLVMRGRQLSVFTGAGIVEASVAEREWAEIDSKNILNGLLNAREKTG